MFKLIFFFPFIGDVHNTYMKQIKTDVAYFTLEDPQMEAFRSIDLPLLSKSYLEMSEKEISEIRKATIATMKHLDRQGDSWLRKNSALLVDNLSKSGKLSEEATNHFMARRASRTNKFKQFGGSPYDKDASVTPTA